MTEKICISASAFDCPLGSEQDDIADRLLDQQVGHNVFHPDFRMPVFMVKSKPEFKFVYDVYLTMIRNVICRCLTEAFPTDGIPSGLRVGCVFGTTGGGMFHDLDFYAALHNQTEPDFSHLEIFSQASLAEKIAEEFAWDGPVLTVSNTCTSGADAASVGALWIQCGLCDIAVVCGFDLVTEIPLSGFYVLGAASHELCRPFDRNRDGMNVGEGVGCLILEGSRTALSRKTAPEFSLAGWGSAADAYHLTAPDPQGTGLRKAILQAVDMAGISLDMIDFILAHGTGTPANDLCEGNLLADLFGDQARYFSINHLIGHTLGASGIIKLIFAMHLMKKRMLPASPGCIDPDPALKIPPLNRPAGCEGRFALSTSLAFGGCNTALILERL